MIHVTETDEFKNNRQEYNKFENSFLDKTKNTVKGLRKTLTKQVADDIGEMVIEDLRNDMYSNFLKFAQNLWKESFEYIMDEKKYKNNNGKEKSFEDFIQSIGYDAKKLRKKIYEDNKDEIHRSITCDYLYDTLEYFFYQSGYWKSINLELNRPHTQSKIMEGFMNRLATDDRFNDVLLGLVDDNIKKKKKELYELKKDIEKMSNELADLIGEC